MKQLAFFSSPNDFLLFGQDHLIILVLTVVLAIFLPAFAKKRLNDGQQVRLAQGMALVISFWALIYMVFQLSMGHFNYRRDLPFDICNLTALLLPILMWKPSQRVNEILYFWILAGTTQAILTPDLENGFPHYTFFKYWFVHSGLVVYIIYTTRVFSFYPDWRSLWRAFIALQFYVLAVTGVNLLLGANYVYVLGKPTVPSALDYLGPWPWYILSVEVLAILFFFLLLLPIRTFAQKKADESH